MIKARFKKAIMICMCIGMLTTGTAYAGEVKSTPVSSEQSVSTTDMTTQQKEIDLKLFETYSADIEKQGFSVTHTSPMDNYIEIGITPYSEENASYLHKLLGSASIKVIEGVQAVPLNAEDGLMYTTTAVELKTQTTKDKSSLNTPIILTTSGVLLLAGSLFIIKKRVPAKK